MKLNHLVDKESGRSTRPGEKSLFSSAVLDATSAPHDALPDDGLFTGRVLTPLTLSINGDSVRLLIDPATTLTDILREHLELTGTKIGCDRGACSACTVWIDGEVAASCMTFALDVRGKKITTIEGLAQDGRLHPIQQAFIGHDAMQCGFCTPGMVMSCAALVEHNPNPSLDDVKKAISGHLCRCGTYNNIFKAVLSTSGESRQEDSNA
jgi:aerobic-type carbon monoxide dehydrogenase small subunit (CoxS/CutS family)